MSDNAGAQGTPSTADKASSSTTKASPTPPDPKPKPKANPAFRALGLPNFRLRLPSRNWTIFLTVVGSWAGAVVYDKRQKKAAQKKWCDLVEHVAQESLPSDTLARRVTIILAAPPGDSIRVAREHFTTYVKPVLVAGAVDWDVIEGRREGEVRSGLAEKIRRLRRRRGEPADSEAERDLTAALEGVRARAGVKNFDGELGDIVIGRHTWKEYVRGLHEGWLGPIDPPKPVEEPSAPPESISSANVNVDESSTPTESETQSDPRVGDDSSSNRDSSDPRDPLAADSPDPPATDSQSPLTSDSQDGSSTPDDAKKEEEKKKEAEKRKKATLRPAHNTPSSYADSVLPPSFPAELPASVTIPLPHLLGVINTPTRIYRFLTRRHVADEVGRQTAAAVLAAYRPYHHGTAPLASGDGSSEFSTETMGDAGYHAGKGEWEQHALLLHEEPEWYKKSRVRTEGEGERVWLDEMVVDPRVGGRMRKFELELSEEERAKRIAKGAKGSPGRRAGDEGSLESESQL